MTKTTKEAIQPDVGELQAGAQVGATTEEGLSIFRLLPSVGRADSNWDSAPGHGEVVVRARSAADARIVAADAELDFRDTDALPGDGNSTDFASAFRNPRLYSVREENDSNHDKNGPRGLLEPAPVRR